jgi:hypothetical protein
MSGNFNRRLAKIEQTLAEMGQQRIITNCNCRHPRMRFSAVDDGLEAELNLKCPAHAERRLANLLTFVVIGNDGRRIPNPRRDVLVEEYERRYARQLEQMDDND